VTRSPWVLRGVAVLAGVAAALAFPPFGFLPGLIGYAVLLRLVDTVGPRPLRSAFLRGWLVGVGYFGIGTWWVAEAFLVDAQAHGWMAPFALVFMAAGLGLFWGLGALVYRAVRPSGPARILIFAAALSGSEWLRGHVLTGFPWNLPGESWAAGSPMSQGAALIGSYGLTLITLVIAASPAIVFGPDSRRAKAMMLSVTAALFLGLFGWGTLRLIEVTEPAQAQTPLVRMVQANIDQKEKWRPENLVEIFDTYMQLSTKLTPERPDVVIWPEGALPIVIEDLLAADSPFVAPLAHGFQPGQILMMGANRAELTQGREVIYFNSLIVLRREGDGLRRIGHYDKYRLVPFGEFLPLGDLAGRLGIRALVHMPGDFTVGAPPRPLILPGLPSVQPIICYEAVFPGFVSAATRRSGVRPAWILNVSNDAWFGATSGPWQHLNIAGYRAIEEGLPVARVTPTGVTAMLDPYGRVVGARKLVLGDRGILDVRLPKAAPPTPFARYGDWGFLCLILLCGGLGLASQWHRAQVN
jgi:apolipoprotein N-acyltransferase